MKTHLYVSVLLTALLLGCQSAPTSPEPSDSNILRLSDGRKLSYVEFGDPDGYPVLYFHGFPGSHQDIHLFRGAELATKYHIRLIAVDRPGYGNSSSLPGRTLTDWPEDVIELINALGLDSFSILGYSGGGPFALACGHALQGRVQKVLIVSGMGPVNAPEAKKGTAMLIPKAPKLILKGMSKMLAKKPEKVEANMRKGFPEVDRAALDEAGVVESMNQTISEAFSSGFQGGLEDARIYKKEWEFDLEDILTETNIWHGEQDENVKIETARYVADGLPNGEFHALAGEGHLSLIYTHADAIFKSLVLE